MARSGRVILGQVRQGEELLSSQLGWDWAGLGMDRQGEGR